MKLGHFQNSICCPGPWGCDRHCILPLDAAWEGLVMLWTASPPHPHSLVDKQIPDRSATPSNRYFQNLASVLNAIVIRTCLAVTRFMKKHMNTDINLQFHWRFASWDARIITGMSWEEHLFMLIWTFRKLAAEAETLLLPQAIVANRKEKGGAHYKSHGLGFTHVKPCNQCSNAVVETVTNLFIFLIVIIVILDLQTRWRSLETLNDSPRACT